MRHNSMITHCVINVKRFRTKDYLTYSVTHRLRRRNPNSGRCGANVQKNRSRVDICLAFSVRRIFADTGKTTLSFEKVLLVGRILLLGKIGQEGEGTGMSSDASPPTAKDQSSEFRVTVRGTYEEKAQSVLSLYFWYNACNPYSETHIRPVKKGLRAMNAEIREEAQKKIFLFSPQISAAAP